jgi:hypothetical protein
VGEPGREDDEWTPTPTGVRAPRQDLIHPGVLKYLSEAGLKR